MLNINRNNVLHLLIIGVLAMLLSFVSLNLLRREASALTLNSEYVTYEQNDDGENTITVYGRTTKLNEYFETFLKKNGYSNSAIELPEKIDGKTITQIGKDAFRNCNMTSFIMDESVETIGDRAFMYCENLLAVYESGIFAGTPSSLQVDIGDDAFYGCEKLTRVYRITNYWQNPEVVIKLGVRRRLGDRAFAYCKSIKKVDYWSAKEVSKEAFCYCSNLVDISLGSGVVIREGAFKGCVRLGEKENGTECVLGLSAGVIEKDAFYGCNLNSVVSVDNIEYVHETAFDNNRNLNLAIITPKSKQIRIGDSKDLTLHKWVNKEIEKIVWSSSANSVVKVEETGADTAKITGLGEGESTIYCRLYYKDNKTGEVKLLESAYWTVTVPKDPTIDYDANGGINAPARQIKKYGEEITLSTQLPYREGYFFHGWSDTQTGELVYNPGDQYSDDKDLTLYAIWSKGDSHNYIIEEIIEPASCEEKGYGVYKCSVCGAKEENVIPATGHEYDIPNYTWNSDYSSLTAKIVCKNDRNHSETETVATSCTVVYDPTCTERGKTKYTSHAFQNSAFEMREIIVDNIASLGHDLVHIDRVEPGCDHQGQDEYWKCSRCNKMFKDSAGLQEIYVPVMIPATGHDYDGGVITKEATCTAKGIKIFTCANCGDTYTESLSALGHNWGHTVYNWNNNNSRVTAKRICLHNSSHTEVETATVSSTVIKNATCSEKGRTRYRSASFANKAFSIQEKTLDDINALGHDLEHIDRVEPGCEHQGQNEYWKCSRCDKIFKDSAGLQEIYVPVMIPATGHDYDGGVITKEATCTTKGEKIFTCANCGDTYTESLPALGHDWNSGRITKEATCEENGIRTYTCKNDASHTSTESIPATGHDYDDGEITKAATCKTKGVKTITCGNCGDTYTESVQATGHNWGDWKELNGEQHQRRCTHDDSHFQTEEHQWDAGTVTKTSTTAEMGIKLFICKVCNATKTEKIQMLDSDPSTISEPTVPPSAAQNQKGDNKAAETAAEKNAAKYKDVDSKTPSAATLKDRAKANKKLNIIASRITTSANTKKKIMNIKWKKVKGATNYLFAYRKVGAKKWVEKWTAGNNRFVVKKMKNNELYEFKILVVKKGRAYWQVSKWSKVNYRFYASVNQNVKAGKKSVTVTVKKNKKASGYEVLTYTRKKVSKKRVMIFKGAKKTKLKVTKLKAKKAYLVQSRPYKTYKGKKYVGILNREIRIIVR